MSAPKRLLQQGTGADAPVPTGSVLSRDDAKAIIERVVTASKADEVRVTVNAAYATNLRFAANQVSTSGTSTDANVFIQSAFGARSAGIATNDLSPAGLERTVRESETLARLSPEDPEAMPELGPQQIPEVRAYFDSTADITAADRAQAALTALEPARKAGDLAAAGFIVTNAGSTAIGNNKGLFAYHRSTNANYTLTVRTADGTGSGWAGGEHNDWKQVDFAGLGARAIEKARLSRNPVAVEPGRYTVIFEPQAVGDLVQLIAFYSAARIADEGRSPFTKPGGGNKVGERVVDPRVTIAADPADPNSLAQPFDAEGLPLARQVLINKGVLEELYYTRFWAKKMKKPVTGAPTSFIMSGGDASMDDMIRSTKRGILVTRLWYLREVDPRTILYTGLTRDGTFLVEDGKITKAVKNFRFNDSPLFMLNNLEAIGRPVRLAGTENGGVVIVPPIKVRDFSFTSLSDAV